MQREYYAGDVAIPPVSTHVTTFEDSRRWRNVVRRPGDIVISTPPKSGTSWTQRVVASLLWPNGDAPGSPGELSPWVDALGTDIEVLVDRLEAQTHRRFMKTHSPGDCIPFDDRCRYIVVYRDGRDALLDDAKIDEWKMLGSPTRHLSAWWPRRHAENVLFVHYNDVTDDLQGEMQRIAGFLDIELSTSQWPAVVDRCRLGPMRAAAGMNSRWHDDLSGEQVERYLVMVADELSAEAAAWLEQGSQRMGRRPEQIGQADDTVLDTGAWHPVFSRLGRQRPTNSIDAIAERRVHDARQAGLFDDLQLHGKPIPDLDRQRQPGWWANQFVAKERNKVTALQLEQELREAMPALWRLDTEADVRARVVELNRLVDRHNRATTLAPIDRLHSAEVLATWKRLRGDT